MSIRLPQPLKRQSGLQQTPFINTFSLFFFFSEKLRLDISCESSARQRIHMKHQALFSLKNKSKKIKSRSLRKSNTSQYGLEIEKIDFSETLPIFNLY